MRAGGLFHRLRAAALLWLACCAFLGAGVAHAEQPSIASDRSVKAAYIYRFLPYIEWPPSALAPGEPLVIGVLAADDLAHDLDAIVRSRPTDERRVVVRRLGPADAWTGVHVLFAGRDAIARVQQVLKAFQDHSVLTISDAEAAVDRGFVIGFVQVDSRLRFEVNGEAAERSGLRLSSRLLSIALRVRSGGR